MIFVELQYRESLDATTEDDVEVAIWRDAPRTKSEELRADFDDLDPDKLYDLRVRYVQDGVEGDWAERLEVAVPKATAVFEDGPPPAAPVNVRQTTNGCLAWVLPEAGQIEGVELRTVPGVGYEGDFDGAEPAQDALVASSPAQLCTVQGGQRTALLRAVTFDGAESEVVAYTYQTRPLDDGLEVTVKVFDERAAGYPGDLEGGVVAGQIINGVPVGLPDDDAPAWATDLAPAWTEDTAPAWRDDDSADAWPEGALPFAAYRAWQFDDEAGGWGELVFGISYVWSIDLNGCDAGPGTRLTIDTTVFSPNGSWRIRFRVLGASEPAWTFDGAAAWTVDSAPAWKSLDNEQWAPWPGQLDSPRAGRYQFQIAIPAGRGTAFISALSVRVTRAAPEAPADNAARILELQAELDALKATGITEVIVDDYTLLPTDRLVRADCSAKSLTIQLLPGIEGQRVTFFRLTAGGPFSVTIAGAGDERINDAPTLVLSSLFDVAEFVFVGGVWLV